MTVIISILVFILGLSFGSFLSVVVHRLQNNEKGIILGRSRCPHCKKNLKNVDLIPLFSYLFLKGKCRFCKNKISYDYFFLELITGLWATLTFIKFNFIFMGEFLPWTFLQFVIYFIFGLFFIAIFFADIAKMEIPNLLLYPFLGFALIGSLIMGKTLLDMVIAAMIALIFFGGQIYLSKGKWLGEGDLYLGIAMALIFGWQQFLLAICLTYLIGSILSIGLMIGKKAKAKTQIPFAPFMVMGSVITIFLGQQILNWYIQILITNFNY